jgi:hypothetical protein
MGWIMAPFIPTDFLRSRNGGSRPAKKVALPKKYSDLAKLRERQLVFYTFCDTLDLKSMGNIIDHLDKDPLLFIRLVVGNETSVNLVSSVTPKTRNFSRLATEDISARIIYFKERLPSGS